jgi:hypothetical protein
VISSHLDFPQKHPTAPQIYQQRTRPCPGIEILSSRHFPPELQGNLLVANVIGFQGILQYHFTDKGSSLGAREVKPIVKSSDENFRPADVEIGPDGAIYFTDWHNPIIGHMQHNLRDPNRDRVHGRVYRVTWPGRPLEKPAPIARQPIPALLERLKDSDNRVRYRARIELSARPTSEVIAAARQWLQELATSNDPARPHQELEALWLFQSHNVVDPEVLARVLSSPSENARAAAVRVAAAWQDRLPNILDVLRTAAEDPSSRVRLMAVWAASFVPRPESAEVVLLAQEHPSDRPLDYLAKETMRTLAPLVTSAEVARQTIAFKTEAGARYLLQGLSNDELLKRPHDRLVLTAILTRAGMTDAQRHDAASSLAWLENSDESRVLVDVLERMSRNPARADVSVAFDLVRQLGRSKTTSSHDDPLDRLIEKSNWPALRQLAFATLVNRDGSPDAAWSRALTSTQSLEDFLNAVSFISDPGARSRLYE